jgi:PAS domain S-box-containing protein
MKVLDKTRRQLLEEIRVLRCKKAKLQCNLGSQNIASGSNAEVPSQQNITEKRKAEKTSKESQQKYRKIFDTAFDTINVIDGYKFCDCNNAMVKICGFERKEDIIGLHPWDISPSEQPDGRCSKEKAIEIMNAAYAEKPQRFYWQYKKSDGTLFDVDVSINSFQLGQKKCLMANWRDITEYKKAEEALRVDRDKLQALMDGINRAGIGIDIVGVDHKVLFQNKALEEEFGKLNEKCCYEHYMAFKKPCSQCPATEAIQGKKAVSAEQTKLDGREYQIFSAPLPDVDGTVNKAIEIVLDITDRKKTKKQLIEYQQQLRYLASELTKTEEEARHQIAVELHDNIGHNLALAKIKTESLCDQLACTESARQANEIIDILAESMKDVSSFIFELSPAVLYELGLDAAIDWLVKDFEKKSGINCIFNGDGKGHLLSKELQVLSFRSIRELLVNVRKHARAKKVYITSEEESSSYRITVKDDGIGFEPSSISMLNRRSGGGFGLFSVIERLDYQGGSCEIESKLQEGTKITLTIPKDKMR